MRNKEEDGPFSNCDIFSVDFSSLKFILRHGYLLSAVCVCISFTHQFLLCDLLLSFANNMEIYYALQLIFFNKWTEQKKFFLLDISISINIYLHLSLSFSLSLYIYSVGSKPCSCGGQNNNNKKHPLVSQFVWNCRSTWPSFGNRRKMKCFQNKSAKG